ncbi:MAG: hypothetical protein EI684_21420 [Candidatus Viridilinea halotolerans]|uniref:Uncharacterized protein n=1 Tax=Candidatus Viridilinea halotolerans TaxID=2491704 RepID=A0A426TRE5_9CHLR|nr:MAG: hypothetical protein EI684_21420 [Candidatus Viridilinea halotolerans]
MVSTPHDDLQRHAMEDEHDASLYRAPDPLPALPPTDPSFPAWMAVLRVDQREVRIIRGDLIAAYAEDFPTNPDASIRAPFMGRDATGAEWFPISYWFSNAVKAALYLVDYLATTPAPDLEPEGDADPPAWIVVWRADHGEFRIVCSEVLDRYDSCFAEGGPFDGPDREGVEWAYYGCEAFGAPSFAARAMAHIAAGHTTAFGAVDYDAPPTAVSLP